MAITRLKRKERRNLAKATDRLARIKQLTAKPIIKNIDIEAIKLEFIEKAAARAKAAEPKAEKPAKAVAKAETPAEATPETEA